MSSRLELADQLEFPAEPSVVSRAAENQQDYGARRWPKSQQGSHYPIKSVIDHCLAGITWVEINTYGR